MTTEFRPHLWSSVPGIQIPTTSFDADTNLNGAALALREFTLRGYDVTPFGAHIDMQHAGGKTHTVLVTEYSIGFDCRRKANSLPKENLAALLEIQT